MAVGIEASVDSPFARKPFVSLCLIAGDEGLLPAAKGQPSDGKPIIQRLLESVIDRESGPLVDEIAISWNGTKRTELDTIIERFEMSFVVAERTWDGDFAAARQHSFELASGEWRGYLDTDDVWPSPGHPAIAESLKLSGQPVPAEPSSKRNGQVPTFEGYLRALPKHVNTLWCPYSYLIDDEGKCLQRTWHSRFVRWHDGWAWSDAVHEDLKPIGGNVARIALNAGLPILHYPVVAAESRIRRNFDILKRLEATAHPAMPDFRLLYGLGEGYFGTGDSNRAVEYLTRAVTCAQTMIDKLQATVLLFHVRLGAHDLTGAAFTAFNAINIAPTSPVGYFALAETHYAQGNWQDAAHWYEVGRACRQPEANMLVDQPISREVWPRVFAAIAYTKLGNPKRAVELASEAIEIKALPVAMAALRDAEVAAMAKGAKEAFSVLAKYLVISDERDRARTLLAAVLPEEFEHDPMIKQLPALIENAKRRLPLDVDLSFGTELAKAHVGPTLTSSSDFGESNIHNALGAATEECPVLLVAPVIGSGGHPSDYNFTPVYVTKLAAREAARLVHLEDARDEHGVHWTVAKMLRATFMPVFKVVFFAPEHTELWGPKTPREVGIGASEESIVYLAKELAKDPKYDVTVYGPLPTPDLPVYKSVRWKHLREFDHRAPCAVLVAQRAPWVAQQSDLGCKRLILWHQDNGYPGGIWGPKVAAKAEHVFVSHWQAGVLLPKTVLDKIKWSVIGNGVPAEHAFNPHSPPRDPHRVIYASNPSRGLFALLKNWLEIRAAVPDTTLRIFYGWELLAQLATLAGMPHLLAVRDQILERLDALKDQGVTWVGRIGQDKLAVEMAQAGVMAYPCVNFDEGFCVALARAAAAGCIPVFPDTGALPEVQPFKDFMFKSSTGHDDLAFVRSVVAALRVGPEFDRAGMAKRVLTWPNAARDWACLIDYADTQIHNSSGRGYSGTAASPAIEASP